MSQNHFEEEGEPQEILLYEAALKDAFISN